MSTLEEKIAQALVKEFGKFLVREETLAQQLQDDHYLSNFHCEETVDKLYGILVEEKIPSVAVDLVLSYVRLRYLGNSQILRP